MIGAKGLNGNSWPDLDMLPFGWLTDAGFKAALLLPAPRPQERNHDHIVNWLVMSESRFSCSVEAFSEDKLILLTPGHC